jgi:hypothetical protein
MTLAGGAGVTTSTGCGAGAGFATTSVVEQPSAATTSTARRLRMWFSLSEAPKVVTAAAPGKGFDAASEGR